jgi:hypothetical protein
MGARRNFGRDGYQAGERHMVVTAPGYQGGGPLVIVAAGAFGTGWSYAARAYHEDLNLLAATGAVVLAGDWGGFNTWFNDTFLARVDAGIAWAEAEFDADVGRVSWVADSMNGGGCLNWCWRHTDRLGAMALRIPCVAADLFYQRDGAGLASEMDAAYAPSNWAANKADRDPLTNAARIAPFADRCHIWYSANDTLILPSDVEAFAAATGIETTSLGNNGHDTRGIDALDEVKWMLSVMRP